MSNQGIIYIVKVAAYWTWFAQAANDQAVAWGDRYQRKIDAMEAAGDYGPQNWPVEVHNVSELGTS